MPAARVRRLTLSNFRSYRAASITVGDGPVVLVGPHGAGKTNPLQAAPVLPPARRPRPAAPPARGVCRDRCVPAGDAKRASRVNALERSLRSRNRLLEMPQPDPHWLDAVEHETAELAVAVAAARAEAVSRLSAALAARRDEAFPSAR